MDYYLRTDIKYTKEDKENYKKLKEQQEVQEVSNQEWQRGDWEYNWFGNGMLKSVRKPDGSLVKMEYDALGRRISKTIGENIKRFLWDGNILLHEWDLVKQDKPKTLLNELGEVYLEKQEPISNLVTWVYDNNNYNPSAKITGEERVSIINDYLGTPVQAYNENGALIWERELDIYGKIRKIDGDKNLIPFLYQGQYYDEDIELAYNRFRYYDTSSGIYLSQDPIGLLGNNPNIYAFVKDINAFVDVFGLIVENLIRYKPSKVTPQSGSRGTAINRAWKQEQDLINRTGQGTRNWTPEEIEMIKNGRSGKELTSTMSNAGYTGHHINNVSDFPQLKGDPRNIVFLQNANHPSGIDEHLYSNAGHRGNYDTKTKGRLIDRLKCH